MSSSSSRSVQKEAQPRLIRCCGFIRWTSVPKALFVACSGALRRKLHCKFFSVEFPHARFPGILSMSSKPIPLDA